MIQTRESARDATLRVFSISHRGIRIEGPLRNAEAALTGTAHKTESARSGEATTKPIKKAIKKKKARRGR